MNGETTTLGEIEDAPPGLDSLVRFNGSPAEFWPLLFGYLSGLFGARAGLAAIRADDGSWRQIAFWPEKGTGEQGLRRAAAAVADDVMARGTLVSDVAVDGFRGSGLLLGVRLPAEKDGPDSVLFLHRQEPMLPADLEPLLVLLQHSVTLVTVFRCRSRLRETTGEAGRFGAVLDLLAGLRKEQRFVAGTMRFCNELAGRYRCDRVALGWLKGDYVRLIAVSHAENFEKRMDAVRRIETAMEEALDQDEEIVWPVVGNARYVSREHEALAREQGADCVVSIPLRDGDSTVGVFTCERGLPFAAMELGLFRLIGDQSAAVLSDLQQHDCWFGLRWWRAAKRHLDRFVEPRHVGVKLIAIGALVALGLFFLLPIPFRVQSSFILRADTAVYVPAPFDGYLAEVHVEPGDAVAPGTLLLRLDSRELLLEEAAALADYDRFRREAEKARADEELAAMRIASAQAEQARVRLNLTRHRLERAAVVAPFEAVVLEGDLRERIGAPLSQGDLLLRLAGLDDLSVQIEIDQRDVHEVELGSTVLLAFAGRPHDRIAAILERIEPQAEVKDGKNVFIARCRLADPVESWMRPGMTGVSKIEAGERSAAWIATRRTIDFLRMNLWW